MELKLISVLGLAAFIGFAWLGSYHRKTLCGFASFSSIASQVGGPGSLAPARGGVKWQSWECGP